MSGYILMVICRGTDSSGGIFSVFPLWLFLPFITKIMLQYQRGSQEGEPVVMVSPLSSVRAFCIHKHEWTKIIPIVALYVNPRRIFPML